MRLSAWVFCLVSMIFFVAKRIILNGLDGKLMLFLGIRCLIVLF